MNTDKQYASRGLEGARRATARSVDESPFKHRLTPTSRERPAKPRGRRHADTATLHGGGHAAHPEIGRCLYRGGESGGPASRRRTLRLEPDDVASPTHGGGALALTPQKRGRKESVRHPLQAENENLRKENTRLSTRLKQAELIIDVQKKGSQILGIPLETPEEGGRT